MSNPTCTEPGCGLEKQADFITGFLGCPRNTDAHELCNQIYGLKSALRAILAVSEGHNTHSFNIISDCARIALKDGANGD